MSICFRQLLAATLLWGAAYLPATAQTSSYNASAEARNTVRAAIKAMDDGQFKEAYDQLDAAEKLAPGWQTIAYERAFAHYLQKDYRTAIKLGGKLIEHPDCEPASYQMLGNSYDFTERRKKAIETYEAGIKRFPNAGMLYLERGNMELTAKQYGAAREYYEKGIEADPEFPSNYMRAAHMYLISDQEVWGMLYGELFMNMERGSERSGTMGKMLYETYRSEIKLKGDSGVHVSFRSNQINVSMDMLKKKNADAFARTLMMMDLSGFGTQYELTTAVAAHDEKTIDLASLNRIRTRFLDQYYAEKLDQKFPNLLFEYQRQVQQAGHLEAYNYWILRKGDEAAFKAWREGNKPQWEAFADWYNQHPMDVTVVNHFHRKQYRPAQNQSEQTPSDQPAEEKPTEK